MAARVVVIGLDGLPHGLFLKLVDLGVFSFPKNLEGFTLSKVSSSIPEVSNVAWSSIITGKNPGEHGIFGFSELTRDYRLSFPNFTHLRASPFWEEMGLKVAAINIPGTYPARPLKGIMVSGFVAVKLERAVYPESLLSTLKAMDYRIDVDSSKGHISKDALLKDAMEVLKRRERALFELFNMDSWDLFFFVFTETDRVMHFLWDEVEDESSSLHQGCMEFFSGIDRAITKLLDMGDFHFFVISDHGFGRLDMDVNANAVLEKEGFLKFTGEKVWKAISQDALAFSLDPARIYLHDERFERGRIREREKILEELVDLFKGLEVDGRKVVREAFLREDIYKGPYLEFAPDLVLVSHKGFNLRSNLRYISVTSKPIFTGMHTQEDAFILHKGGSPTSIEHLPDLVRTCWDG